VPFAVLAPGGQSGNFWIHYRMNRLPFIFDTMPQDSW